MPKRMHIDPDFKDPHALSANNKAMRDDRVAFITSKLKNKPELVEKMIPKTPPMATRHVLVDPQYSIYDILNQDNVDLVSEPICRINRSGVGTEDGKQYDIDIIVFATGYRVNEFLWPMDVRGRDARSLAELWSKDGARAYLGAMAPGFPNFFMVYGPNSNNWGGLQIVDFHELVTRFALSCIGGLIAQRKQTVEPSESAYWRYNEEVDHCESKMLYSDTRVKTYYKNTYGRSAANNGIDIRRIWRWTRRPASPPDGRETQRPDFEPRDDIRPYFTEDLIVE
jgi:4-hydroxyacetophenone monooxygenase